MKRPSKFTSVLALTAMAAMVTSLTVACGKKSEDSTPVRIMTDQERIEKAIIDTFGDTYNPMTELNVQLAQKIKGASAVVEQVAEPMGDKVANSVRVQFVLDGVEQEVSAHSMLYSSELETLQNDPQTPSRFKIEARCGSAKCENVVARLIETEEKKVEGAQPQVITHQAVVIFMREKIKSKPKSESVETILNEKADKTETSDKTAKTAKVEEPTVDVMSIRWIASPNPSDFFGGHKVSVEDAQMNKAKTVRTMEEPKAEQTSSADSAQENASKNESANEQPKAESEKSDESVKKSETGA